MCGSNFYESDVIIHKYRIQMRRIPIIAVFKRKGTLSNFRKMNCKRRFVISLKANHRLRRQSYVETGNSCLLWSS